MKIRDEITHIRLSLIRAFRIGNPSGAWAAEREKEIQSSLWRAYTICVARFHGTSVKREPQIASSSSSSFLSFTPWKEPTSRDLHRNEISRHVNTRRNVRVWESYVYILPIYKGQLILGLWGYSHRGLEFQKIEFIATGTLNLPVFVWEQTGRERTERVVEKLTASYLIDDLCRVKRGKFPRFRWNFIYVEVIRVKWYIYIYILPRSRSKLVYENIGQVYSSGVIIILSCCEILKSQLLDE